MIVIPSYNTGVLLKKTVDEVLQYNTDVWVVIDGSTDDSERLLEPLFKKHREVLKVIKLTANIGKGAAILTAIKQATELGFTHVLTMDADFQHPASAIPAFIEQSKNYPKAMILGRPVFDSSAPALRVQGRRISNAWANLETLNWDIGDSLFGMRIYPIKDLIAVMQSTLWARRFDFEPEVAVRLSWHGIPVINLNTPVRYLTAEDGGISQFKYLRDNVLLTWMHSRLFFGFLLRLPLLILRKFKN